MTECIHIKVYANYILTSYPPVSPWICAKCGHKGQDRGSFSRGPSYDDLVRKFEKKEEVTHE